MLGKFADLPQEAEEEIRGLDEARRRVAELEREIKRLKGINAAPQIDHHAIERAVRSAVEQERVAWRRKLEPGRARVRRMVTVATSTGQALGQLKELLEEMEREWLSPSSAIAAANPSANHRP